MVEFDSYILRWEVLNISDSLYGIPDPKGKIYSIDSSFKNDARKEGSVTVLSPYNKPISMSFRHQGKYPSLETHGELQYQGNPCILARFLNTKSI
jgi:hypothetical protein